MAAGRVVDVALARGGLRNDGIAGARVRRVRFRGASERQHHARHHPVHPYSVRWRARIQIGANGDAIFQRFMRAIDRTIWRILAWPTTPGDARRDELYG